MQNSITLAEVKAELAARPHHVFHASLSLYIIAESRPRPDNPDWIEIACLNKSGAEGMLVYPSPLDAMLNAQARNQKGADYSIHPFEAIDPRPFLASHDNWFTIYLVYGFAARGPHLLVSERGNVQALTLDTHFHIPPDVADHFHLSFTEQLIDRINAIHHAAGLHDYDRVVDELADCTWRDLDRQAQEATRRIGQSVTGNNGNVTHCALYDPIEQRWRFAAFTDMQE